MVELTIIKGDIIVDYPNDKPYPSCLILAFIDNQPLHIVLAKSVEGTYIPDETI